VLADPALLSSVLTYHVIGAVAPSSQLTSGSVTTLNGDSIDVVVGASGITLDGVPVLEPDILANNAIIHGIGSVLIPTQGEMMEDSTAMDQGGIGNTGMGQGGQTSSRSDSDSVDASTSTLDFVEEISGTHCVQVWTVVMAFLFAAWFF